MSLGPFSPLTVAPLGSPVRLLAASNPTDGVLVARFSVPMRRDTALTSLGSWRCVATAPFALPIELTEVVAGGPANAATVLVRYQGGGVECTLSASGLVSIEGVPLDPGFASITIPILRPGDLEPTVRLFDTVWGPVGMSQRASLRRSVDQLVANRALAAAVNQQLQQRLASSDGTAGRDGRPGTRRS